MNKESLLGVSSSDPSIISRYNNVVSNYNLPGNIVGNVSLRPMPTSTIYEWGLGTIGSRKGKVLERLASCSTS